MLVPGRTGVTAFRDIHFPVSVNVRSYLRDQSYLCPQPFDVQIPNVDIIQLHGAFHRIVESFDEGDDRALPASARSHQGGGLTFGEVGAEVVEDLDGRTGWVPEIDVVYRYDSFHCCRAETRLASAVNWWDLQDTPTLRCQPSVWLP